jgi:hypothetical protein
VGEQAEEAENNEDKEAQNREAAAPGAWFGFE